MAVRSIRIADALALPLEVAPGSSRHDQDIYAAYRRLVRLHHPDAGGSTEQLIRIRDAYEAAVRAVAGWA